MIRPKLTKVRKSPKTTEPYSVSVLGSSSINQGSNFIELTESEVKLLEKPFHQTSHLLERKRVIKSILQQDRNRSNISRKMVIYTMIKRKEKEIKSKSVR